MRSAYRRVRRFFRELRAEMAGRRAGRKGVASNQGYKAVRHVVGPTGNMFSRGWSQMEQGADAFERSFDPRIPPSIHISHRDATRHNLAMPLSERCIEDWNNPTDYLDPHEELGLREDRRSDAPGREG